MALTEKQLDALKDDIEQILDYYEAYAYDMVADHIKQCQKYRVVKCRKCGVNKRQSPLEMYFVCPLCGNKSKLWGFSSRLEIEDIINYAAVYLEQAKIDTPNVWWHPKPGVIKRFWRKLF